MAEGFQIPGGAQGPLSDVFHSDCPGRPIVPGLPSDFFSTDCPARVVVDHVASRWTPLILSALQPAPLRFFEVRDKIGGISEKVLSQKLRTLVRDGLVERTVEPATPPQVSYGLTELGHGISVPLGHLFGWIADNGGAVLAAQERHDRESAT
ncbi:winged helix-turn-helix transcriptional regulator [Umezawaea tangerina]|uniref:HxlR family transcriptional regulator n=1 Tax=Umezawaea tangerina TaxID=84725 RepID=A0A2T0SQD5_9PSEU|nr:helix-turn-helix domain-containing protein [Umezawaea tangerina]PRY35624.1 HxlR family transcriptional regulator [Umezawaea tangerina]